MLNEEKYLKERVGQELPFRVPEGYFDTLSERVMAQLPARKVPVEQHVPLTVLGVGTKKSRLVMLRPWFYAAACLAMVFVLSAVLLFPSQTTAPQVAVASPTVATESSYMDDAADYVMLDNAEIYACLSDN